MPHRAVPCRACRVHAGGVQVSTLLLVGISLNTAGGIWYSVIKWREAAAKKAAGAQGLAVVVAHGHGVREGGATTTAHAGKSMEHGGASGSPRGSHGMPGLMMDSGGTGVGAHTTPAQRMEGDGADMMMPAAFGGDYAHAAAAMARPRTTAI